MSPWAINRLAKSILRGAVIAYPTDTVWGFGCHPLQTTAVIQILNIKHRSIDKGLILLASQLSLLKPYLDPGLTKQQLDRLQQFDESPTTWLVPASADCPVWLRGQFSTIAVRLTRHPFVNAICEQIQAPLVSTSANRSGQPTIRNATQARRQFDHELDFIVTGYETGRTRASRIKSLHSGESIRH